MIHHTHIIFDKATRHRTLLVLCVLLAAMPLAAQQRVYFPYFELINFEPDMGLQHSASRLLKAYIEDHHDFQVLLPNNDYQYYEKEDFSTSAKYAAERNASYVLTGAIIELGDRYVISLGLQRLPSGEQVWHDMLKGNVREDLDPLLSRLGRNFNTPTKAESDLELDELTNFESEVTQLPSGEQHYFGLMIGGTFLLQEQLLSGFGLGYTYDASNVLIAANLQYYPSSSILSSNGGGIDKYRHGSLNIGAIYPFSKKAMTFFGQAGMDYGFHTIQRAEPQFTETNGGIGFFLGGGFLVNRGARLNLRFDAALELPLYLVDDHQLTGLRFGLVTAFAPRRKR